MNHTRVSSYVQLIPTPFTQALLIVIYFIFFNRILSALSLSLSLMWCSTLQP
jgi:hypothetical protein